MKKVKFAVISVIVVLSIVAGLSVLHITNKNKTQDVFEGTDIAVGVDEYIKTQKKEKAPDADNIIFLTENKDVLEKIADYLYEKETITGAQFMEIYNEVKEQ